MDGVKWDDDTSERPKGERKMEIIPAGSRTTQRGPESWFTGVVLLDPIIEAEAPARMRVTRVTFEPGARTAWHRHPLGQCLFIVAGVALIGRGDGPVQRVTPGDTVWFEPDERHWHGAAPDALMTHMAIQDADTDGNAVTWEEHVTDKEYRREPSH
jgi:quercetin dioxygenase-like cupin family protein